jgi:alpha-D-xyloside xylohydrolase
VQHTAEGQPDPIELRVYPGVDGAFTLYEDEGDGYDYEAGAYSTIQASWNDLGRTLSIGVRNGAFRGMLKERTFRVVCVSPGKGTGMEADAEWRELLYRGKECRATI